MKICPKCNTEHNKPGTFCSRKCANSRIFSDESRKKQSESYKNFYASLSDIEKEKFNINKTSSESRMKRKTTMENKWSEVLFEDLPLHRKKKQVISEQNYKCLHCGIDKWLSEPIKLELDHIDGNNTNDERNNLRALCPNCHSFTPTWRKGWKYTKKKSVIK